ncbi:hypothetical protein TKK_0012593 [Trichogramma kaykai]|uniref:RING-type domain-containing protein n=1 Tax=Trichogramma kaykai TaxID=54128 RepID=A0ABD2WMF5_9HYME
MACEACASKFSLFKRKKQCMDCLRYFCTECVIRRFDRILSCDNCSMLSRRPLIRSQVLQMRSKYLRQYLLAKKVSIKGCIEKEDLVNLIIVFANGNNDGRNTDRIEPVPQHEASVLSEEPEILQNIPESHEITDHQPMNIEPEIVVENIEPVENSNDPHLFRVYEPMTRPASGGRGISPERRSRSPQPNERLSDEISVINEFQSSQQDNEDHDVEIEEVLESDDIIGGPEPVITEHEENLESANAENISTFKEVRTWTGIVKLSDIKEQAELESLSVKQLKDLLQANRVDYKGCVERCELFARALRLWEEYQKSRKIVEGADEDGLCKICLDAPIECVILECGHMACCINCGKQMAECPICRQYVVRVVRFFKA